MKYLLGFKNNEIAERLNLTTQAVENRLYRGKEKISKNFLKEFNTI
ncbi:sigma factor-like helix-turn-helix DNA-binding protein [Neobacillus niacini]|nr:sigma factor-like helix-turn-helix DNA-binding protein [Neobacillus niacini]